MHPSSTLRSLACNHLYPGVPQSEDTSWGTQHSCTYGTALYRLFNTPRMKLWERTCHKCSERSTNTKVRDQYVIFSEQFMVQDDENFLDFLLCYFKDPRSVPSLRQPRQFSACHSFSKLNLILFSIT
jgi:hypothetical protein